MPFPQFSFKVKPKKRKGLDEIASFQDVLGGNGVELTPDANKCHDYTHRKASVFTNAPASPVISSVVEQDDKVVVSIDVTAVKAGRIHARKIELFNRIDGGEWGLIAEVNLDELGEELTFPILDNTYKKVSTIDYRAFAVNGSRRSSPAEETIILGYTAPEVTDLNIKCGVDSFGLNWANPTTRLMKAIVVKVQALVDEDGAWDEDSAVECYRGFTDHFSYKILEAERDLWHTFWVSCEV